jgi:hypothetical protein
MTLHLDTIPTVDQETNAERKKIVAAMRRLLITGAPKVVAPESKLVIGTLATEAGVPRCALSHRHIDLKDLYLGAAKEIQASELDRRSPREKELEEQLREMATKLSETQADLTAWTNAAKDLARIVAALDALYKDERARCEALARDVGLQAGTGRLDG